MSDEEMDLFSYFEKNDKKEGEDETEKGSASKDTEEESSSPAPKSKAVTERETKVDAEEEAKSLEAKSKGPEKAEKDKEEEKKPHIWTVSEITREIRGVLEKRFDHIWLSGEISNFSRPRSGHIYLTLKDEGAQISAVMWRSNARKLQFDLEDGLEVLVSGRVTVYAGRGNYQIIIDTIEPKGIGALQLKFEQMKKKLKEEGLFRKDHKKPLPQLPRKIGIVTSPTSAAIRDMLKTIYNRFPMAHTVVYPARVQGEGAALEIARGVEELNRLGGYDVIIVGRGGGSLEDLWAFNEEVVARAIYASEIPVISAVGHEVDVSISDLVADWRSPTPTAAGEKVVPRYELLLGDIQKMRDRILQALQSTVSFYRARLDGMKNSYAFRQPEEIVANMAQKVDELSERLFRPSSELFDRLKERLDTRRDRLFQAGKSELEIQKERLESLAGKLDVLSPLKILSRGYSITLKEDKKVVKSHRQIEKGELLTTHLDEGKIIAKVEDIQEPKEGESTGYE